MLVTEAYYLNLRFVEYSLLPTCASDLRKQHCPLPTEVTQALRATHICCSISGDDVTV